MAELDDLELLELRWSLGGHPGAFSAAHHFNHEATDPADRRKEIERLSPKGDRLLTRLKVAGAASLAIVVLEAHPLMRLASPTCLLVRSSRAIEPAKADRLKAGGIKPGTWD